VKTTALYKQNRAADTVLNWQLCGTQET